MFFAGGHFYFRKQNESRPNICWWDPTSVSCKQIKQVLAPSRPREVQLMQDLQILQVLQVFFYSRSLAKAKAKRVVTGTQQA